ncbi:AAA family ATPase [Pleurostoma richardsiae]|uniref:AAA family ATPase n=1 Tax=Pleurostoma richardsiae TaxID=41990 RepID=A0AA38RFJ3_9PEZI|nr:AAA family ATPase [Pleurostoma richardsiae]
MTNAGKESIEVCSQVARASKLSYKQVEESLDDKTGRYKITEPTDSGVDELDQYVFVIRDRINRRTQQITTFFDIKSPFLRDILREVYQDYRSVSLADSAPSIEQSMLFHVREELKSRHRRLEHDSKDTATEQHLGLFVDYIEAAFQPIDERLSVLLAKDEITYDLIWALFKPNAKVFSTCPGTGAPRCFLYDHCEEKEDMNGSKFMSLQTRYLGSDGKVLGEVTTTTRIPYFRGASRIEHLQAYPLHYHAEPEQMKSQLVENGRKFVSLIGSYHHQRYEGRAFDIDDKGEIVACHVCNNIVVDATSFKESKPNYPRPRVLTKGKDRGLGCDDATKRAGIEPTQLDDEDFLVCSPTVLGFCLETKKFLEFAVAYISDVKWSGVSFDDVKIPDTRKDAIKALMHAYMRREPGGGFSDVVQGKGRSLNFLLHGPPGVGKTLTAEVLAETHRVPLYTVAAGQIGTDHVRVEKILKTVFRVARRWNAVLLLDEADTFLAQRTTDPSQIALVSVFLRELEYFDGVLFLTTNRVKSFDPAILSRIQLSLKYGPLGQDARRAVLLFFLAQAKTTKGPHACRKSAIDDLAKEELNGRDIRNAVFVAQALAEYKNEVVNEGHLKASIAMRKEIQVDVHGAGALENLSAYM